MNSNVLSTNEEMVTQTNAIYGSNRVNYNLFVMGLCGTFEQKTGGKLVSTTHKQINYNVAQKFPEDKFASVLKATATELAQVHGAPTEFIYNQYPVGVEFILSNMQNVNPANIEAGIVKNLLKKFDFDSYIGVQGNFGLKNNPNTFTTEEPLKDYPSLVTALTGAVSRVQSVTDLTSDDLGRLTFSYTGAVAKWLNTVDLTAQLSNLAKLKLLFPNMRFKELPANLESVDEVLFYVSQDDMLTFHYASIPAKYAQEQGKYGLSTESLFTYESSAVEVEELGAVQLVTKK